MRKSSPRRFLSNVAVLASLALGGVLTAQEVTSFLTPDVERVGSHLACRCGTCRNTVGDCAMLHCSYCERKRHSIWEMKQHGMSDDSIVSAFVKEDGIATLAAPPSEGLGPIITWAGPGIALGIGFVIYAWYVRRNKKAPATLAPVDEAVLDRFRSQIESELDDSPQKTQK